MIWCSDKYFFYENRHEQKFMKNRSTNIDTYLLCYLNYYAQTLPLYTYLHEWQLSISTNSIIAKRIRKKEHLYLVSNKLKVWKLSSLKTRKKCPAHDDNDDEVNNRHTMDSEGTMESIRKLNKSFETTYVLQYIYRADRETTETWKSFNLV